jgi:membrane-bound serine protease (ClpP class)
MKISDPNMAYLFMMIAVYGILFEFINPGSIFPGVIGLISGITALYSFNMLPFNYAGLMLIILGIALMAAEIFITGFGILGIGGAVAFGLGSFLLFDAQTLQSGVSIPLIVLFSLTSVLFFLISLRYIIKSRSQKIVSGIEQMIGSNARIIDITPNGYLVRCHGEIWKATSDSEMKKNQTAVVESVLGLTLKLKPAKE